MRILIIPTGFASQASSNLTYERFKSENVKRFSYMFQLISSFLVNVYKSDVAWKAKIQMILSDDFLQETAGNIFMVEN